MKYDMETTIQLPDEEDVDVYIEFEVTSWGSPGCAPSLSYPGDPPEPPEFEILKVIRNDNNLDITKFISEEDTVAIKVDELVLERLWEIEQDYGDDEP